jgi:hypothetical protein
MNDFSPLQEENCCGKNVFCNGGWKMVEQYCKCSINEKLEVHMSMFRSLVQEDLMKLAYAKFWSLELEPQ